MVLESRWPLEPLTFGRLAVWIERCEVDGWGCAGEKLGHNVRGCGGEKDAVAVVARGDEVVGLSGESAEERKTVGGCGAEAGPGFELRGFGKWREKCRGEGTQTGEVGGVEGLVEAGVFYCCADDGSAGVRAGGARDYIDVGCADDEGERKRGWQGDREHLALFRDDLDVWQLRGGGGPGSGAVYELFGVEGAGGGVKLDRVVRGAGGEDGSVGAEVDGGGADGGEKCGSELAGIEAVLVEEDEAVVGGDEFG
jgi:hypothetical protein